MAPSIMDTLFQQTLDDLIKTLRHSPTPSLTLLSASLSASLSELSSTDPITKSTALLKLTYLNSLHPTTTTPPTLFASVQLSSSQFFHIKRVAYLSASLSFPPSHDLLFLFPNQLRKDLLSPNPHENSLALGLISSLRSPDLSNNLTPEIFNLLSSSKLFIRKKAIAASSALFKTYPDSVRVCFKKLVENLEDSENSENFQNLSVTVGVFCELVGSDPGTYLPLAPEFYKILVDSRNNWVLIKVLKIFAKLVPLEPRLAKKVVGPICEHIKRTSAKSLVFECIRTIFTSFVECESAVRLGVEKVREFLVGEDPNLKWLGLQALAMLTPIHTWAVVQYKDVVIRSLSDTDPNVKLEALGLVMGMVCEDNVKEICKVLVHYALKSDPIFCNEILGSILVTCGGNFYEIVNDFDWYVSLLGEISRVPNCQKGEEIETQMIDIGIRVRDVRPELVRVSRDLVIDPALLGNPFLHRILSAVAWVSGEYVEFSKNPIELTEALLQPRTDLLPPSIRAVYVQSVFKVLVFCLNSYFFPNEAISMYLRGDDPDPEVDSLVSERDCENNSDLGMENEEFNPRISSELGEGDTDENRVVSSPSLKNVFFTHESILHLFKILKTALFPLLESHEVEILERVRNILGLVELVEKELCDFSIEKGEDFSAENSNDSEIIRLMHGTFSEELGLVSMIAQERVQIPDGFILVENLNELDIICAGLELPNSSSFSLIKSCYEEKAVVSSINYENEDPSELASESTSLLTQHRKRHGLYYLPSDTKEISSYEYPPANEPNVSTNTSGEVDDLVKLTEQSLVIKKKTNQAKPRPVVVKLDEGDEIRFITRKPLSKDNSISGVVRESSDKASTSLRKGKEKETAVDDLESVAKRADNAEVENIVRKSKHRSHGKERKNRSSSKDVEEREDKSEKDKKRRSHGQGKSKGRHRADGDVHVVTQSPVIPDFLL